ETDSLTCWPGPPAPRPSVSLSRPHPRPPLSQDHRARALESHDRRATGQAEAGGSTVGGETGVFRREDGLPVVALRPAERGEVDGARAAEPDGQPDRRGARGAGTQDQ